MTTHTDVLENDNVKKEKILDDLKNNSYNTINNASLISNKNDDDENLKTKDTLDIYLDEIKQYELLTDEEKNEYFLLLKKGVAADEKLKEYKKNNKLDNTSNILVKRNYLI